MRGSRWLVTLVIVAGASHLGPASALEPVAPDDFELTFTPSQEILRPGDPFSATVTVTNLRDSVLTGLLVKVEIPPQAVDVSSSETPEVVAQAAIDPAGSVTWQVEELVSGASIDLGLTGIVVPQVVDMKTAFATATVSHDTQDVESVDILLTPIVTINRDTGLKVINGIQTVVSTVRVTPNAEVLDLTIVETLTATIDAELARLVPMKRVDNAQASAGRLEWVFPSPKVGEVIDVEYRAEYPSELNAGLFDVTHAGSVADGLSELSFSGEETVEIATPHIEVTDVKFVDDSPDDPIRPGDVVAITVTFENTGEPIGPFVVRTSVDGSTLEVTESDQGGQSSGSAISWPRSAGEGKESVSYKVAVKKDIFDDREAEVVALVEVDGTIVARNAILVPVDTERRQGSNTSQWFSLIVLFMVLGFGALLLFARSPTGIEGPTAYVAVVIAILTAILILAFGLELASETTLTLLGAIAGYVLGERKWQQHKEKQAESSGGSR